MSVNTVKGRQVGTSRESTLPMIAGLSTDHQQRRIICLPLWVCLQALGREGVHTRTRDAFLACERIWSAVDVYRHVRVLVRIQFLRNFIYPIIFFN